MRPMTFYGLVAAVIFAAMTAVWAFSEDEPAGAVFVISTVLWWGSALTLVFFGLVTISRWGRKPEARRRTSGPRAGGS
jgi:hypothetical protein